MKKYILVLLIAVAAIAPFFMFKNTLLEILHPKTQKKNIICDVDSADCQENILNYLKLRKDRLAKVEIEKALKIEPNDLCALWAKAEILRRRYKLTEAQDLLNEILSQCPNHASSLISLSYIKYHNNKFDEALKLLKYSLNQPSLDRENKALAYVLIGSINAKRSFSGGFLTKVIYGIKIQGYFEKAKSIAPDLSETRLGLGSFYLFAPKVAGGDIDKAIEELKYAVELAPDFATANARLAQAYKKKGNLEKYKFYLERTQDLDPANEVLKELKSNQGQSPITSRTVPD